MSKSAARKLAAPCRFPFSFPYAVTLNADNAGYKHTIWNVSCRFGAQASFMYLLNPPFSHSAKQHMGIGKVLAWYPVLGSRPDSPEGAEIKERHFGT